jgi:hypothetical protein
LSYRLWVACATWLAPHVEMMSERRGVPAERLALALTDYTWSVARKKGFNDRTDCIVVCIVLGTSSSEPSACSAIG